MKYQAKRDNKELNRNIKNIPRSKYPGDLPLHPSDPAHDKILHELILPRVREGFSAMSQHIPDMKLMDWALDGFMPMSEVDRRIKQKDSRKPVVLKTPLSFQNRELYLTHMNANFVTADGMHFYQGLNTESRIVGAAMLEGVVERHSNWFDEDLALDTVLSNCFSYGGGVGYLKWSKKRGMEMANEKVDELLAEVLKTADVNVKVDDVINYVKREESVMREGTQHIPINMYQWFQDPTVPISNIQEMEYCGWMRRTTYGNLCALEMDPEENRFNTDGVKILAEQRAGSSEFYRDMTDVVRRGRAAGAETDQRQAAQIDEGVFMCRIIPSDWGLGSSTKPELWMFMWVGDMLLTGGGPIGNKHSEYPLCSTAPTCRGLHMIPVAHGMTIYGFQEACDWMAKALVDNTLAMNNRFIMNPAYIEHEDFKNSDGPMVVRMKRAAFSGDVPISNMFMQIPVHNVTERNWDHINNLMQMAQNGIGTNEILQGSARSLPERPTARGMDVLSAGALSRINRLARIIDAQYMRRAGYQMAHNAQQYMERQVAMEIIGRRADMLRKVYGDNTPDFLEVSYDQLAPDFDVLPYTAAVPRGDDVTSLTEFAKTVAPLAVEQGVFNKYDLQRWFTHYFKKIGMDTLYMFEKPAQGGEPTMQIPAGQVPPEALQAAQMQGMPEEQLFNEVDRGNMVPMSEVPAGAFA